LVFALQKCRISLISFSGVIYKHFWASRSAHLNKNNKA
jgi:hypothetical protein